MNNVSFCSATLCLDWSDTLGGDVDDWNLSERGLTYVAVPYFLFLQFNGFWSKGLPLDIVPHLLTQVNQPHYSLFSCRGLYLGYQTRLG